MSRNTFSVSIFLFWSFHWKTFWLFWNLAFVMELVDILVLGTSALVRVGSNPTEGRSLFHFFSEKKKQRKLTLHTKIFVFFLSKSTLKNLFQNFFWDKILSRNVISFKKYLCQSEYRELFIVGVKNFQHNGQIFIILFFVDVWFF